MRLVHKNGLDLVETWEGLFLKAYRDIAGVWTIGWGHTGGVYKGQQITRMEAEQLLTLDLADAANEVDARAPNATDDQFDALTSFTFNVGKSALRGSTLLRKFKAGDILGAADQFLVWDKAHVDGVLVVVQGLLNRRRAERSLFLGKLQLVPAEELMDYHAAKSGHGSDRKEMAMTATAQMTISAAELASLRREEWFGWLQSVLEDRIKDAPDETCRTFARNLWDQTAEFTDDDT